MKKRNKKMAWPVLLLLCAGLMAGCSGKTEEPPVQTESPVSAESTEEVSKSGGTLILKVNPEIAVEYDESGKVTAVYGRNEDGRKIVENYQDYIGKECSEVVEELVGLINDAGYFVEEVEGESRKITIEIETGSILPEENFVDEIVAGVQTYVKDMQTVSSAAEEQTGVKETEDVKIYDQEYGAEAYEVVIPSENKESASEAAPPAANTEENAGNSAPPDNGSGNAAGNQVSPYTDYETPYMEAVSPDTNYETPYVESPSPDTNYETPYTEPATPYTDDHYESPYEASHYGDSGYSHYH